MIVFVGHHTQIAVQRTEIEGAEDVCDRDCAPVGAGHSKELAPRKTVT